MADFRRRELKLRVDLERLPKAIATGRYAVGGAVYEGQVFVRRYLFGAAEFPFETALQLAQGIGILARFITLDAGGELLRGRAGGGFLILCAIGSTR